MPSWKGKPNPKASRRMPGLKPKADREPARPKEPRKPRPHGFARARMTPTHRVEHVVEQCPDCGTQLSGGWGPAHSGGDRPVAGSGAGNRARLPDPHLSPLPTLLCSQSATGRRGDGQAAPGGSTSSDLIAVLREEARLPLRTIQWHLDTVHGLQLSLGGHRGRPHSKWLARPNGWWRTSWNRSEAVRWSTPMRRVGDRMDTTATCGTFSTPNLRYFLRRNRGKAVVDEVLGDDFARCAGQRLLRRPTTTMRVPNNAAGPTCCGTSTTCDHSTQMMDRCPSGLTPSTNSTVRPRSLPHPAEQQRRTAKMALERRLLVLCRPYLDDPSAAQARLCRRMEKHIKELFVFVAEPEVPPDNNAARAQPAPSGGQPQRSVGAPARTRWYCHQDDAGVNLRHLAGTRSQHPQRLPSTTRFPSSLNSYVIYPRDSVAEMATTIALCDAGWSHAFRSDLDRIDQYSGCGVRGGW